MAQLTCSDSGVVVGQEEPLHPVLHVLQDPAVGQLVPGSLDGQPVQALGRVVLDHLWGGRRVRGGLWKRPGDTSGTPAYLPDALQDVGGEGGHSWRPAGKLHQHGEQLEEGIGSLGEEEEEDKRR